MACPAHAGQAFSFDIQPTWIPCIVIGGLFKQWRNPPVITEDDVRRFYDSVPVTLLTGFLGSGKTTLLNDILADPAMHGTAVIVNEFGTVPIDHDLVRKGSESYFRTTTGCICCTATSDIRSSLSELHEARLRGDIPLSHGLSSRRPGLPIRHPLSTALFPADHLPSA